MAAPTLNGIAADPTSVAKGGTSTITVDVTAAPDTQQRIRGEVVGTEQAAEVVVTTTHPVRFTTDPATATPDDVLLTTPDGGSLTKTAQGVYEFDPAG